MEILRKTIHCKSLENSQQNFYDGVSSSKVISLQFSDWNFALKRIHHKLILENIPKTSCLKKKKENLFLRKKCIMDQRLNKAAGV